jgi:hypothetical protein
VNIDEALRASSSRDLLAADVQALLSMCPEPPREALDRLSVELAGRFILGRAKFVEADAVVRVLHEYAVERDVVGAMLEKVQLAFNDGGDDMSTDTPHGALTHVSTRRHLAKLFTSLVAT